MKKLILFLLIALTVLALASCGTRDKDTDEPGADGSQTENDKPSTEGIIYELSSDKTYASVTGYMGTDTDIVIAGKYTGVPVTAISAKAFENCKTLTSVTIPGSVTSIGEYAFDRCTSLTSTNITNGVTSIGKAAFLSCASLRSVNIPDSVTSIGNSAFEGCTSLASINIPKRLTSIGYCAFTGCTSLASITVDASNSGYKSIDGNLYSKDGKTLIHYAVGKADESFTIPDGVTSIGDFAFRYCSSLKSINIPNGVTNIGDHAFEGCKNLTSVTIPDSVTCINSYTFLDCKSLENVNIPNSVTIITVGAFANCESLKYNTYVNGLYLGNEENPYVLFVKATNTSITSCDIHKDTKFIHSKAFTDCTSLSSIIIQNNVKKIENYAFTDCTSLTDIYYTGSEEQWNSISKTYAEIPATATIHYNYSENE